MKSKFGYILDNIFTIFLIFICVFLGVRHFIHNKILLIVLTIIFSIALSIFAIYLLDRNNFNIKKSNKIKVNIQNLSDTFLLMTKKEIFDYLKINVDKNVKVEFKKDYFCVDDKINFVPILNKMCLIKEDCINVYKKYKFLDNIVVLGNSENLECELFRKKINKDIDFMPLSEFYLKYLTDKEVLSPFKKTKIKILPMLFTRKQSKKYFILTIFFSVYAFIFRYNKYYFVVSGILCILTIYSLKNKKFNNMIT